MVAEPETDLRLTRPRVSLAQVQEELVAWIKTLISAAVYAILIVTFGFQVARVEGLSMAPTLADQDRLIVNKLAYRIGEPRRSDIVMLYYPLNPDKSFVKRVIAEEGDTVRIVDGKVYVNEVPLNDDYVPQEYRSHDDWGPQVIPEGYYFVMGDHRNNSSDSRTWGFVPKRYIIGKVQLRWWPVLTARIFMVVCLQLSADWGYYARGRLCTSLGRVCLVQGGNGTDCGARLYNRVVPTLALL